MKVDSEASSLLSETSSAKDYSRMSKSAGNKVVVEAEVHHRNELPSVNHKQNLYRCNSNHGMAKKLEGIELDYAKIPNQDDSMIVIDESKVCMCCTV